MFSRKNLISLLKSRVVKYVNVRYINEEDKKKLYGILHSAISSMNNQSLLKKNQMDKNQHKLRHVKYREKKGSLPPSSSIDLHVIGSGGPGTSKSVIVITSHASYLFNCGEGTQRMANEKKLRLAKLENIFITHKSWDNIGGLFGMCLTLEKFGVPVVNLHGPQGIENVTRDSIVYAETSRVYIEKQRTWKKGFSDSSISVEYVPILPEEREKYYMENSDLTDAANGTGDGNTENTESMSMSGQEVETTESIAMSDQDTETTESMSISNQDTKAEDKGTENIEDGPPAKKKKFSVFSPITDPKVTMAYIVKPHKKPPSVSIQKCVELGLPRGPMIGLLKDGQSVTLDDGTVIHPEQILSDEEENPKPIIIVECPSEDHLYSLLQSKQISECCHDDNNSAEIVVHMTPATVVENSQYQMFIRRFPSSTIHLFLNEKTSNFSSQKSLQTQTVLNMLHPSIFPSLNMSEPKTESTENDNLVIAKPFLRYSYRPTKGLHWDNCVETDEEVYRKEITDKEDVMKCIADFQSSISTNQEKTYPEVTFLGTGSSVPSVGRNVTGILLNIDDSTSMILDCGEGTAGQLFRTYGEETDHILSKIKVVYISHLHPDHHLGLVGILNARSAALARFGKPEEPILLCAPIQIKPWLSTNQEQFGVIKEKLILVPNQFLMKEPYKFGHPCLPYLIERVTEKLNVKEFLPFPVIHNNHACGISITHNSGWKVVFSGDTRPCNALVEIGKDCDLLIHEATFEDKFSDDAVKKRHSTMSEAIDIGMKMRAKFIILTHFSQRYPKIPLFENTYNYPIGLAFDYMKVKLNEMNILTDMISPLQVIFQEDIKKMIERSEKVDTRRKIRAKLEALSSTTETKDIKQSSSSLSQTITKSKGNGQSSEFSDHNLNEQEKDVQLKQTTSS